MTDRETLVAVAAGYNEIMALEDKKRAQMALMLRVCLAKLKSSDPRQRAEGIKGLSDLADLLEAPKPDVEGPCARKEKKHGES